MSEVDKHYGSEPAGAARPGSGRSPQDRTGGSGSSTGGAGNVSSGVRDSVGDAVENAGDWSRKRYKEASSWASDSLGSASRNASQAGRRSAAGFSRGRRTVENFVEENPIMVGVVGLAAGLIIGALLPGTRRENEYLGRYADEVRDQGLRYAQEVAEQGRHLVAENIQRLGEGRDRDTGDETAAMR
ncbi:hypothetical protein [Enterovirga sp.]|uniref:hypothetical protein n=1 Tax=Enterovirga sp. TaxID=2026350 RepID=UPI002614147E|nr:hypothetical protein [Enterovirga sp.]MDB5592129.1 hypothetical protein [Enterovirga sp.]